MSRVITFSRTFPAHHPRKGEPTYFVEKLLNSFLMIGGSIYMEDTPKSFLESLSKDMFRAKKHTIRAGDRWEAGDYFSPRVWSGKPYASKQIQISPDVRIERTAKFEMDLNGVFSIDGKYSDKETDWILAQNDGLTDIDMFHWLMKDYSKPKEFIGQIIIWDDTNLPY